MRWWKQTARCDLCGALVLHTDAPLHLKWHRYLIDKMAELTVLAET
jgi:hypothetical protein